MTFSFRSIYEDREHLSLVTKFLVPVSLFEFIFGFYYYKVLITEDTTLDSAVPVLKKTSESKEYQHGELYYV